MIFQNKMFEKKALDSYEIETIGELDKAIDYCIKRCKEKKEKFRNIV